MRVISGRVFFRGQLEPLSIGIDETGRIAAIKKTLRGDETVDHGEALILPGCVDPHVHMRDPGLTHKEDFPSGTRSAAIGGVTTVADMPNTVPPVTTGTALNQKEAAVRGRAAVDYALYAAPPDADGVGRLARAAAFKVFMAESTGNLAVTVPRMEEILQAAAKTAKVVVIHAEDPREFTKQKARDLRSHSDARPKIAEETAVATVARAQGEARLHIAHVTCVEALDEVPANATCEVTPHHLFLDSSKPLGTKGKVNPPLRSPADREALWEAFRGGRIDAVASDHAPHTLDEKGGPFEEAPAGMPGVATAFPLLMRRTRAGELDLPRLVSAMATRPAEILGIPKGTIEVGRDADLIVVDPREIESVTAKRVQYKCGWTPFEGMEACFPRAVYLRGETIVEDREPVSERRGRLVHVSR
ncbi:MAG TPA: dihydroorotase [Thermoplasmata archaeon]|nr:dihydroorotase [Thermoplasmata archaeon]